jgi:hypothetical protein
MKDKYYTPTLEELISHVIKGEIVYVNIYGNSRLLELPTENSILYLMAFLKCHANIVGRSIVDLDPDQFRVKYLDEEDIISIGFKNPSYSVCTWYELEGHFEDSFASYGYWSKIVLIHCGLDNKIKILAYEYSWDEKETVLFAGTIKNISEFKTLLKQLNLLPSII